ncbi:hypothetical protein AB688_18690 [Pseudomonas putida]|nr:hypothetical protein AB688_18690 [Pseudomonas putida]
MRTLRQIVIRDGVWLFGGGDVAAFAGDIGGGAGRGRLGFRRGRAELAPDFKAMAGAVHNLKASHPPVGAGWP